MRTLHGEPEGLANLLTQPEDVLDTEDEEIDPTFDLNSRIKSDSGHIAESFCEEWVCQLEWEDRDSLGLFLCFQLTTLLGKGETEAAGMMIGKSDKTIHEWRSNVFESGEVPHSKQGQYQRTGVLWKNEDLNKKASRYIRENAAVKGNLNLTAGKFSLWVNDELLPNETLEPGFPRKISAQTARKWMHQLGFEVLESKKGTFVDGHEREDVVEY